VSESSHAMSMNDCEPINFAINAESLQRRLRNVAKTKVRAVTTHSEAVELDEKPVIAESNVILSVASVSTRGSNAFLGHSRRGQKRAF